MLREMTANYIDAFNSKDIDRISSMLCEEFVLEDPVVKRVEGKMNALMAIEDIFTSCSKLSFNAKNIYVMDSATTLIEFSLNLDEVCLKGVDIIEWNNGKIKELRAYLDVPK
ncbi:nuclear transport factor 2 family protein [Marinomonas sp. FW-1]|uniref:nuclear transport factor 2 family protein n=1 Tax=Marinomonas sp. FW-1 TaxID=2071621 RepID=UPI0010BF7D07|nr:nuclear transport factor 2 family protein [Marinomonas sp. FW-1]